MNRFSRARLSLASFLPLVVACGTGIDSSPRDSMAPPIAPPEFPPAPNPSVPPVTSTPPEGELPDTTPIVPSTPPVTAPPSSSGWQAPPLDPATPVGIHGQLRVEGTNLVDRSGAPVQLRG